VERTIRRFRAEGLRGKVKKLSSCLFFLFSELLRVAQRKKTGFEKIVRLYDEVTSFTIRFCPLRILFLPDFIWRRSIYSFSLFDSLLMCSVTRLIF
jgi:hypothetical protein